MDENHAIALVDCNNFYAPCEMVVNPELQKRPVVAVAKQSLRQRFVYAVDRDTVGLGKIFSKSVRFL